MARGRQALGGGSLLRLALSLAALVLVLGVCPALALADEVEVEPEGHGEETVFVQDEGSKGEGAGALLAQDLEPVTYLDDKGAERTCTGYVPIESGDNGATWTAGWYVVKGVVGITGTVKFAGDVNLILADDAILTIAGDITTDSDAGRLSVYGQRASAGKLNVTPTDNSSAIYCRGDVTVNGGTVEVTAAKGRNADGIYAFAGDVTVNGGTVIASGDHRGIISYAFSGAGGNVTVNDGTVTAFGNWSGVYAYGAVTIEGGTVTARGDSGITTDASDSVAINGGVVEAKGTNGFGVNSANGDLLVGGDVGSFTASGTSGAWVASSGTKLKNDVVGLSWADVDGTEDEKVIAIGEHAWDDIQAYKKVQFPVKYTVTVLAEPAAGGVAKASASEAAEGKTVDLVATPEVGYEFAGWTVAGEGATIDDAAKPKAKLTMGTTDVTITAAFKKVEPAPIPDASVTAHVQRVGWMAAVADGGAAGTVGKSRRLEALTLKLPAGVSGGIEYRGHVQRSGWEKDWRRDGKVAGTVGKSRRVEAVQVRLTGAAKDAYDVYYRMHVQRLGWMAWAKNGASAGTQGMSRRAEAIQVVLVTKGSPAPGATHKGVTQQYAKAFVKR